MNGEDIQVVEIAAADFDLDLLPQHARTVDSEEFKVEVRRFFEMNLRPFAAWYDISVENEKIRVSWKSSPGKPDALDEIIKELQQGKYQSGIQLLRLLLPSRENDESVHYNLGMALSDMGELDEAEMHLRRAVKINPAFTNAKCALGVALSRKRQWEMAREVLEDAMEQDPDNPYTLRNLGACLLMLEKDIPLAAECLLKATVILPEDQQSWLGLGQALEAQEKVDDADAAYRRAIEINPYSQNAEIARRARSLIAEKTFKEAAVSGERPDAVMYCLSAMEKFASMTRDQVQRCAFEIAALGTKGINVNDPSKKYTLKSLPGTFTGLKLLCYEYVGFKQVAPHLDIGFDLAKEYESALRLSKQR